MKNLRLTISFVLLGILFVSMTAFVLLSRAASEESKNPYDDPNLGYDEVIDLYHKNINDAFNEYIKKMVANLQTNPDDPNGKPFEEDGTPFTVEDCYDPANAGNYSTFCVGVNLLGADWGVCTPPNKPDGTPSWVIPDDMKAYCSMDKNSLPYKGYLNFAAALHRRNGQIFDTINKKNAYIDAMVCLGGVCSDAQFTKNAQIADQRATALAYADQVDTINKEIKFSKMALDQTLSAYDQLKIAWPIHLKYIEIYKALEKYRDKIVEIRHATDNYPAKFIDLTTTSCT